MDVTLATIVEPLAPVLSTWLVGRLSVWWRMRQLRIRNGL